MNKALVEFLPNDVTFQFNMFCTLMKARIVSNVNSKSIVTKESDRRRLNNMQVMLDKRPLYFTYYWYKCSILGFT